MVVRIDKKTPSISCNMVGMAQLFGVTRGCKDNVKFRFGSYNEDHYIAKYLRIPVSHGR